MPRKNREMSKRIHQYQNKFWLHDIPIHIMLLLCDSLVPRQILLAGELLFISKINHKMISRQEYFLCSGAQGENKREQNERIRNTKQFVFAYSFQRCFYLAHVGNRCCLSDFIASMFLCVPNFTLLRCSPKIEKLERKEHGGKCTKMPLRSISLLTYESYLFESIVVCKYVCWIPDSLNHDRLDSVIWGLDKKINPDYQVE